MTTRPTVDSTDAVRRARPPASTNVVVALLVGSAFVMILNETIMSVALPALIVDLRVTASTAQWLTSGFLLTMAVVIPTTGYLLQRFPARGIYLTAMLLFCAGTLLAALAPGFAVLLAARMVQACGTAVMVPLLITTIMNVIPADRRGQTMGTISIVIAVAPAVGPTMSGVILDNLGWRWMFWIVLPIALAAMAAGAIWLRVAVEADRTSVPLDVVSVPLSAVAFAGLVYGMASLGESAQGAHGGVPPWVPLAAGAVALVVFVVRQLRLQRRDAALLDLRPFTYRRFTVSIVLVMLGFMALFGGIIMMPLYVQDVLHRGPFVAGLVVLPGGLLMGVAGPFIGRAYDRFGARRLVVPGALMLCAAMWSFVTLDVDSSIWQVVVFQSVMMVALALMFTPLMTDSLGALPDWLYSHGSAILTTLQQVAGAAGAALFVTVMTLASTSGGAPDMPGVRAAFLVAAVVSVAVVVVSLFTSRDPIAADPDGP